MQNRHIQLPQGTLHYLEAGEPSLPKAVLLHGGGIDSAHISWRHIIKPLAKSHHVLAPDLPGYGDSPPPEAPYTTELLIDTLTALMNAWEIEQAALMGLSMGGATVLGYTLENPERVRRLVLVDSYGLQDTAPFHLFSVFALRLPGFTQKIAWRMVRGNRGLLWWGLANIFYNPLRVDREILDDAQQSIRLEIFYEWLGSEIHQGGCRTCYIDQLPTLKTPILLVHGENDPSISVVWAQRAAQLAPNATLHVIPRCGHWPTREKPAAFNEAVLPFLTG